MSASILPSVPVSLPEPLDVPIPPNLERAVGYDLSLHPLPRYVGFFWTAGDKFAWSDGQYAAGGMGNWQAFLAFLRHVAVAPFIAAYHFGCCDFDARHWFVVDREQRCAYALPVDDASRFLTAQFGDRPPPASTVEVSQAELDELLLDFREVMTKGPSAADIAMRMNRNECELRTMLTFLNASPHALRGRELLQSLLDVQEGRLQL